MRFPRLIVKRPQYLGQYVPDRGLTGQSRLSESLNGLLWSQARIPPRRHLCWPQTKVHSRARATTYRCACGAWSLDGKKWINRNLRRKRGHLLR